MFEKIVVITRKTRLMELIERFNSRAQAKFYIEHAGGDFADYEKEDDAYRRSLDVLRGSLELGLRLQFFDRSFLPTFIFTEKDLVIAIGQDGLVANAAKYVGGQPLIGVNPDPERFDGILVPFRPAGTRDAATRVIEAKAKVRTVTLAEAVLNDGQKLLAFNELFLGMKTHVSARYTITVGKKTESQSSSGLIVSTGAGSTGWLSSMFRMAAGVTSFGGGTPGKTFKLDWEDPRLLYMVREPFTSRHSQAAIVAGFLAAGEELVIESRMPANGVIFSDGVEADCIAFNSGAIARLRKSSRHATLVAA